MTSPHLVPHAHRTYRVLRHEVPDPLDDSRSQLQNDNRWNTRDFPALYACCSLAVARVVVLDRLGFSSITLEDLTPDARPMYVEVRWSGQLVDVVSPDGIAAAGFPAAYPQGVEKTDTRRAAAAWHAAGLEGVLCRSASIARLGLATGWVLPHEPWGETAIFTRNTKRTPRPGRKHVGVRWLRVHRPRPRRAQSPPVESAPETSR